MTPPPPVEDDETRLAARLFKAQALAMKLESDFYDTLCERFGGEAIEDTSYDAYDSSFELYGAPPDWRLSPEALTWAWGLGFERCWINHVDGTETHYNSAGATEHKAVAHPKTSWRGPFARERNTLRAERDGLRAALVEMEELVREAYEDPHSALTNGLIERMARALAASPHGGGPSEG